MEEATSELDLKELGQEKKIQHCTQMVWHDLYNKGGSAIAQQGWNIMEFTDEGHQNLGMFHIAEDIPYISQVVL